MKVCIAAVQITACINRHCRRFHGIIRYSVMLVKILDRPAVRYKMSLKAPVLPQDLLKLSAGAAGLSIGTVIGPHYGLYTGFLYQRLKCRKVGFLHVLWRSFRIKFMTDGFRPGMHGIMLGAGSRLHGIPVSLQPLHISHTHPAGQIGILSISLMSAAPAGITENIHIGSPEGQALVNVTVFFSGICIVFSTSLGGNHIRHLFHQCGIKGGSDADRLWKNRSLSCSCHPMDAFVPPVICRHSETGNGGSSVFQLGSLFLQRHLCHQCLSFFSCFFSPHSICILSVTVYQKYNLSLYSTCCQAFYDLITEHTVNDDGGSDGNNDRRKHLNIVGGIGTDKIGQGNRQRFFVRV